MQSTFEKEKQSIILDHKTLRNIEEKYGSSFYLLDVNKLEDTFHKMKNAFESKYKNFIIGYSYKTNYLPYLCKMMSQFGAYAEVVSRLEYDLAIKLGVDSKKIIFNGPLKTKEDLYLALRNESIVNIDSLYEIPYVKSFAHANPDKTIQLGLRVNFDISEDGVSILQEGYELSRFGICTENGSFQAAINELKEVNNIKISGLHGHFSTKNRTVDSYRKKTERLCKIAKEYITDTLEFIDIGGGIYGELPKIFNMNTPTFDDYAKAICEVMNREFKDIDDKPALILEPGVSMVADAFVFVSKVIDTKKITDKYFVLVDGSVHNIKPTMHKSNLPMELIKQSDQIREKETFNIVGYTCMEKDYLAHKVHAQLPQKGDYVIFENVGAYTIVFNPPFIKERPGILTINGDGIFAIRERETFNQFFNEELYKF